MFSNYDPDVWETTFEDRKCIFHEFNPGGNTDECRCGTGVVVRRRPQHETDTLRQMRESFQQIEKLAEANRMLVATRLIDVIRRRVKSLSE